MRLFVAIPLPEDVRERLSLLCSGLPAARWVEPETMHLSLRFLGEVDGRQAADVDSALGGIKVPAFAIELAGIGQFGDNRRVRALWVGVEPQELLMRLQAKVENAVQRAGLAPEGRKYRPHVTLARFKQNPPGPKLGRYLHEHGLFRHGPVPVDRFALFSSFLSASGAIHRVEADYPLEPPAPEAPREASG